MHVGHCRGAVFGDALANLLAFTGYAVTREYYVNDAGAQVDALARSAFLRYRQALGEDIGERCRRENVRRLAVGRVLIVVRIERRRRPGRGHVVLFGNQPENLLNLFVVRIEHEDMLEVVPRLRGVAHIGLDLAEELERHQVARIERQHVRKGVAGGLEVTDVVETLALYDVPAGVGRMPLEPLVADLERLLDAVDLSTGVGQWDENMTVGRLPKALEELVQVIDIGPLLCRQGFPLSGNYCYVTRYSLGAVDGPKLCESPEYPAG